jgi:hypothetical protein
VWVSLETWLIGDGQVPELVLGAVVRNCGLRLNSSYLNATDQLPEGVREVRVDDAGRVRYEVTGRCQSVTSPMAALIALPGWRTIAEPEAYRAADGALDFPALEPWSERFRPPAPNEMLKAEGWLAVVADHEWDAFAIPDSRMDWRVQRIQLVEHQVVRVPGELSDTHTFGPVIRAIHVDRLSRDADGVVGAQYLVDLLPA